MNDIVIDILGIGAAFFVFPLFVVFPGFVIGWITNALRFRLRTTSVQLLLSLVFSVALCPILTYLIGRVAGLSWVWIAYGVVWTTAVILVASRRVLIYPKEIAARCREYRLALSLVAFWLIIAIFSFVDVQVGGHLYGSVTRIDYAKHVALTGSLLRTGVPPANPFFSTGLPQPICYYYLWHLICSLVGQIVSPAIPIRLVVYAGTLWADLAFFAIIPLCIRLLPLTGTTRTRRQITVSIALLYVGGLDVMPVAVHSISQHLNHQLFDTYDIELWNDQVSSWFTVLLWVPQHVASLVAALTGLLILRNTPASPWPLRLRSSALCGIAFASSSGMSVFIILVLTVALACWLVYCLVRRWYAETVTLTLCGVSTVVFALPLLLELKSANSHASLPLAFTVRRFYPLMDWIQNQGLGGEPYLSLGNFLALPLNYFLEFGFFAVAGFFLWLSRRRQQTPLSVNETLYVCLFVVSAVIATFLRSTVQNNDMGWRGFMFAQFSLLIWTGHFLSTSPSLLKPLSTLRGAEHSLGRKLKLLLLGVTLTLGFMTTGAGLIILRLYPVYLDKSSDYESSEASSLAYNARDAYRWVSVHLPTKAVVQQLPRHNPYFSLYAERQALISDLDDPYIYGPSAEIINPISDYVTSLFPANNSVSPAEIAKIMSVHNVSCLVVFAEDDIWRDKKSWVWKSQPAYANSGARVYLASDLARSVSTNIFAMKSKTHASLLHRYSFYTFTKSYGVIPDGGPTLSERVAARLLGVEIAVGGLRTTSSEESSAHPNSGGTKQAAQLSPSAFRSCQGSFTIEQWFMRSDEAADYQTLLSLSKDNSHYLIVHPERGDTHQFSVDINNGWKETRLSASSPAPEARTLMTIVYDAASESAALYIDGVQEASQPILGGFNLDAFTGDDYCGINGLSPFGDPSLNGVTEEFRLYRGTLTPPEIKQHFKLGPRRLN